MSRVAHDKVTCPLCEGDGRVTRPWRVGYWVVIISCAVTLLMNASLWLLARVAR